MAMVRAAITQVAWTGDKQSMIDRHEQLVEPASQDREEIVVRDLDLDEILRARNDWQFYRDRRPESYVRTVAA